MYEINTRIKNEMERQGLTMTDLARLSGLNRSSISRYVSNTIEPKQNAIGAIAKALGVPVAWLLGFDDADVGAMDVNLLTETNKARLKAYYDALIESQKGGE